MAKSRRLRIQSVNRVFPLTLTFDVPEDATKFTLGLKPSLFRIIRSHGCIGPMKQGCARSGLGWDPRTSWSCPWC